MAYRWARGQHGLPDKAKLVLLELAWTHGPEGCIPSQQRLVDNADMALSTVKRQLKFLSKVGLITIFRGKSVTGRRNAYLLHFDHYVELPRRRVIPKTHIEVA